LKTIGLLDGSTCESSVENYPLLVKQDEGEIPLFDTTLLHAHAAVRWALK